MFSKLLLLVSLFVAVVVAAPAPSMSDRSAPSIIGLKSNVSCTSIIPPGGASPTVSPSVILLNNPSPTQSSPYNSDVGYAAAPQGSGSPSVILLNGPSPTQSNNPEVGYGATPQVSQTGGPSVILLNGPSPTPSNSYNPNIGYGAAQAPGSPSVINLNAPAPSSPVINLNRRQFSSAAPTSTFSFGGIVPSSSISFTPLSSTPTASSSSSFSFGGIITSSPSAPAFANTPSPVVSNGLSTFSSKGTDGIETVLLLSTVTVTVATNACSSTPTFSPTLAFSPSPVIAPSSSFPFSVSSSSPPNPTSSPLGVNVQASSPPVSSVSIIDLNTPPATTTSAPGFSFSSAPVTSVTPTV